MHFNFDFTTAQILWTLTFAALLVLLVVLLGRDRVRRFPFFTASIVLTVLRMLASRLLYHRVSLVLSNWIFLVMADLAAILAVLVAVEIARRAFAGAPREAWLGLMATVLVVGGVVLWMWSPWPSWKTLTASSQLQLLQLLAEKTDLFADVLMVQLGLLVVLFGRNFKAGWHSHTQQLAIGLCMASIAQLTIRSALQHIASHVTIQSQDDYKRVLGQMNSLNNANSIIFVVVILWWIVCLWMDEPGTEQQGVANSQ